VNDKRIDSKQNMFSVKKHELEHVCSDWRVCAETRISASSRNVAQNPRKNYLWDHKHLHSHRAEEKKNGLTTTIKF